MIHWPRHFLLAVVCNSSAECPQKTGPTRLLNSRLPNGSFRNDRAQVQVLRLLARHPPQGQGARHKLQCFHQHVLGLGRGRSDKTRPPASRSLEPHPALFLHCSASPNPGSEFATHEQGPFRPRPPSRPGLPNQVAANPAAGLDRVRRRKGVASAAAPHPCPRLRFCERRRRGAGAVGGARPRLPSRGCGS